MNGAGIIEAALQRRPELLGSLLQQLSEVELSGPLAPLPGAPLTAFQGPSGAWLAVTVVEDASETVRAGWPHLLTSMAQKTGADGDLLVITSSKETARWARRPLKRDGRAGTKFSFTPAVLQIGLEEAEYLLRGGDHHAALFAAWAIHRKDGPRSRTAAVEIVDHLAQLPESDRTWWLMATLQLLNGPQLAHIRAMHDELPRSEAFLQFLSAVEAQAQARGKTSALLRFLDLRRIPLSPDQRALIAACSDPATVDRWLEAACSAAASNGAVIEAIFSLDQPPAPAPPVAPAPAVDLITPDPPAVATPMPPAAASLAASGPISAPPPTTATPPPVHEPAASEA